MFTLFQKIRSVLDKLLLKNLRGFLTGSQFLIVNEINVSFRENDLIFARRSIACNKSGTCFSLTVCFISVCVCVCVCVYIYTYYLCYLYYVLLYTYIIKTKKQENIYFRFSI